MGATPLTLRCPRCKKYREWDHLRDGYDKSSNENLKPTGKTKIVATTSGRCHNVQAVQMLHDGPQPKGGGYCGHVFWTTHPDGVRKVFPNGRHTGNAFVPVHHSAEVRGPPCG